MSLFWLLFHLLLLLVRWSVPPIYCWLFSAPTGPKLLEEWIPLLSGVASAGVWLGLRRSAGPAFFVPVAGSSLCLQLPI
jgi:hypothetical protein